MIHELRCYTIVPGGMPEYLRLLETVSVPIRGDRYGKLLGFWVVEIGAANHVFHLWEHDSLDARQRLREELFNRDDWQRDLVKPVERTIEAQTVRLMETPHPVAGPKDRPNVYEVTLIRAHLGRANRVAAALADLAVDAGSHTVGWWTTIAGDPNEVVHIAAHRDLAARVSRTVRRPAWVKFMTESADSIRGMSSSLAIPAIHSPMQ